MTLRLIANRLVAIARSWFKRWTGIGSLLLVGLLVVLGVTGGVTWGQALLLVVLGCVVIKVVDLLVEAAGF
jgi:hypothetical protein